MTSWQEDEGPAPTPEQLAAYADGELDSRPERGPLRRRVEAWLARHPEAAADLAAQQRLARLWQESTPAEPSEAVWADMLARLELVPSSVPAAQPGGNGRVLRVAAWTLTALAATAAAIWLSLLWLRPAPNRAGGNGAPGDFVRQRPPAIEPRRQAPEPVEPFAVASADEVEILSVRGGDTGTLVVGELPFRGPLVLVGPGDVEVTRAEPEVRMGENPTMVWTPLVAERTEP